MCFYNIKEPCNLFYEAFLVELKLDFVNKMSKFVFLARCFFANAFNFESSNKFTNFVTYSQHK